MGMQDRDTPSFGMRLRWLREAAGLTQEELAERAGLTAQGVGALERGDRRRPYPHTVQALAMALGVSEDQRLALLRAVPRRTTTRVAAIGINQPSIPVPLTALVGRERETAELQEVLVHEQPRLLTLVGPGGVGKTRLAIAVANGLTERFHDGIVFVSLSSLDDPVLVMQTVASAVGLQVLGGSSVLTELVAYLGNKHLLLILDNMEHLLEASSDLSVLLASSVSLRILVTSRAPLRIQGEQEYAVSPLSLPDLSRVPTRGEVAAAAAAQLFVRRAREVAPSFELTTGNASAVAAVCRRLDGLPLAIELAAAWIKILSPTALLAQLDRALPLLTAGARDLPARQQTMGNAIAWSHNLILAEDQVLFRRLSVFAGGFTLEVAVAVGNDSLLTQTSADQLSTSTVLVIVASLADKSLLQRWPSPDDDDGDANPRFGMLETVREFAVERLAASGEEAAVRTAHATWYLGLAERAEHELWGPQHRFWQSQLVVEYDNLRTAVAWASEQGQVETGLRLTHALWRFIRSRGHANEARRWQARLMAAGSDLSPSVRIDALWLAGDLAGLAGDYQEATDLLEESLAHASAVGNQLAVAKALYLLGNVAEDLDDLGQASIRYDAALALFRELGDPSWIAETVSGLGRVARKEGKYVRATALHEEALTLQRGRGNVWGVAWATTALGEVAADEGSTERAVARFGESTQLHRDLDDLSGIYYCLFGIGKLVVGAGYGERGARLLGAAEALREARGLALQHDHRASHDRAVTTARTRLGRDAFVAAWAAGRDLLLDQAVDEALVLAAELTTRQTQNLPAGLSNREVEVLRLLATGRSNAEIGEYLFVSPHTVRSHLHRIYAKLEVTTRAAATRFAVDHGLT